MTDLRLAIRQLLKHPGFTAVAVLTLALGIGATTAIFSVVYGVLIQPYPYAQPKAIWVPGVSSASTRQPMRPYRHDEFEVLAALPAFADMMATSPGRVLLSGEFAAEEVTAPRLTANAFRFLGVRPILGRTFGPEDVTAAGEAELVTVLSFTLWRRLFGGDPDVLGRTLRLDDQRYTVVGVMPPRFGWWTGDGLWLPLTRTAGDPNHVFPIARLRPGVEPEVARQQLESVGPALARANPGGFPKEAFEATLTNYLDLTVASGEMQRTLALMFGAVGFLLLIACANIANLQLARATARTREMAIRAALGAGRRRLVRQLLGESVVLSVLGGGLGLALGVGITRLMVVLMPAFNIPNEARIEVNAPVLLFGLAVSVFTGVAFGLVPALTVSRPDLVGTLKDERTAAGSHRGGVFRASLVVAEVALSVVLLVSAALTMRSFLALHQVELGFRPEQVVAVDVMLPTSRYATFEARNRFAQQLIEQVEAMPGVRAATIGNGGVPFGGPDSSYAIEGQSGSDSRPLRVNLVSAGYLKTLGIALRRGRMLEAEDMRRGDRLAVINEAAAALWPAGEDPLGGRLRIDLLGGPAGAVFFASNSVPDVTVVGIVANTRNNGLAGASQPTAYIPFTRGAPPGRTLALRATGESAAWFNAVREVVRTLDAQLPVGNARTLEQAIADQTAQPRFTMALFGLFAVVGLALAAAGQFSVLTYLVSRRTREIGVRMALGAQRWEVIGLVLKDGGRLAGLGMGLGAIASLGAARVIRSQVDLFQVSAIDPVSFAGVLVLMSLVALIACWLPARRAARVDPMEALRTE